MSAFHFDRERLIETVSREAQRVVDTYDKSLEAESIAHGAQEAVAASAIVEVGAVGLGALITAMAATTAADVTGILLASLVAVLGIFVIPAKRRSAKNEMHTKVADLRQQLTNSLRSQFEQEINRSLQRINEAISPYTRFVRAERDKLQGTQKDLDQIKTSLVQIKTQIEEI